MNEQHKAIFRAFGVTVLLKSAVLMLAWSAALAHKPEQAIIWMVLGGLLLGSMLGLLIAYVRVPSVGSGPKKGGAI